MTTLVGKRPLSWGSAFTTVALFVGAAALTSGDEVAVGAPFIAMNELFGWWGGFFASMALWLLAGFASLALVDLVWPKVKPWIQSVENNYSWIVWLIAALAVVGLVSGLFLSRAWISDKLSMQIVGLMALALLFILAVTVVVKLGDELIRAWVRKVMDMTSQMRIILKPAAILAVLVYMGPALSWALLSPLGITRKGVYWLTFVAAPLFTVLWYPFYTGVWETITGRVF